MTCQTLTERTTTDMRPERSLRAEAAFRERLAGLGAELLEPEWLGANARHRVRCAAGHECYPYPTNVVRGIGPCRTCAGKCPATAEAKFRGRLAELGATPLFETYRGAKRPHHVRCSEGHDCWPRPSHIQQGSGVCRKCAHGQLAVSPALAAEVTFLDRLRSLGATPLYEDWQGTKVRHQVRCSAGHECRPTPASVLAGNGICRRCAGCCPETAEAAFRVVLTDLGATPLFTEWRGVHSPHHVRCAAGHDCYPHPGGVFRGRGICRTCAGNDPVAAEAKFRAKLADLGATPLYEIWQGAGRTYLIRCVAGHDVEAWPTNVARGAACRFCAGNSLGHGEPEFRTRLLELGASPLYEEFLGSSRAHHARCSAGHDCWPIPSNVRLGQGICRECAGKSWDAFYVVTSRLSVKFGITSGDPTPRLARHAKQGFPNVVRIAPGLPGDVAPQAERAVKSALALAGERPVRGREYFDISCLGLVVDVSDSYTHLGAWS